MSLAQCLQHFELSLACIDVGMIQLQKGDMRAQLRMSKRAGAWRWLTKSQLALLTVLQVADRLTVSRASVWELVARTEIATVTFQPGRRILLDASRRTVVEQTTSGCGR